MKLAIMQPYFFPYIGYFQLIAAVDTFVVYDNIKYTKKGWINRNRMLRNGEAAVFSLPLASGSDSLDIRDRALAREFDREKLLAQFRGAYARAPQFDRVFALLAEVVRFPDDNLFGYLHHGLLRTCAFLGIGTPVVVSSEVPADHSLKSQARVLALCEHFGARTYINPIGGTELYADADFAARGIDLRFLRSAPVEYPQFGAAFVPWLSIVDVLMFNTAETVAAWLRPPGAYELLRGDQVAQLPAAQD